ncbi:MAG: Membrane-bound lytic murein transglycosylase B [Calditrichaeota bacterium]|nr:Membrane-bound lytic murein transglycosylase B [Calditrichota bacterium]
MMALAAAALLAAASGSADDNVAVNHGDTFDGLTARLIHDDLDASVVYRYFDDPRFELLPAVLRVNVKQPDVTGAYERFKSDSSIRSAREFLDRNREVFETVLADSPVNPEVVAAILKVESDFGGNQGSYPLLNVYASLTLLDSDRLATIAPDFWERVLRDVPATDRREAMRTAERRRAAKARWAYRELKTLLEMAGEGALDPLAVTGSWAGAFGMAQFIPSSAKAYARDGNGDDAIDLTTLDDSIASVAHYLEVHRYRPDSEKRRRKAVWHYNHSDQYVDCILTIADEIARPAGSGAQP